MSIFLLSGFPSGVTGLYLEGDGLACHKGYHPAPDAKNSVQHGLFPDVVVRHGAVGFQLLAEKIISC